LFFTFFHSYRRDCWNENSIRFIAKLSKLIVNQTYPNLTTRKAVAEFAKYDFLGNEASYM